MHFNMGSKKGEMLLSSVGMEWDRNVCGSLKDAEQMADFPILEEPWQILGSMYSFLGCRCVAKWLLVVSEVGKKVKK